MQFPELRKCRANPGAIRKGRVLYTLFLLHFLCGLQPSGEFVIEITETHSCELFLNRFWGGTQGSTDLRRLSTCHMITG
jgi:hypothetical protein